MARKILLGIALGLGLLGSPVWAQDSVSRNPSEVIVRGRRVPHSWSDGKVWIAPEDALTFLQFEARNSIRVDLLGALLSKGYTYSLKDGVLIVNREAPVLYEPAPWGGENPAADDNLLIGSAEDPSTARRLSFFQQRSSGDFFLAIRDKNRDNFNAVLVQRGWVKWFKKTYQDAVTTARASAPGESSTIWEGDVTSIASMTIRAGADASGGFRWVKIDLLNAGSPPVDFYVPVSWRSGSELAPDHARAKSEFEALLSEVLKHKS